MSIFGAFKKGRKAAKDHIAKKAELQQQEQKVATSKYRHVPTHAASDALMGSPFNCTKEDASKIREHNKRRSELLFVIAQNQGGGASASSSSSGGSGITMPGPSASAIMLSSKRPGVSRHRSSRSLGTSGQWPRANSSLSKVTYPDGELPTPGVHAARSYSSLDAALHLGTSPPTADALAVAEEAEESSSLPPDATLSKGASSSSSMSYTFSAPQTSGAASSRASSVSEHPDELEEDMSASCTDKGKEKLWAGDAGDHEADGRSHDGEKTSPAEHAVSYILPASELQYGGGRRLKPAMPQNVIWSYGIGVSFFLVFISGLMLY